MTEDFAQLEANIKYLSSGGGGGAGREEGGEVTGGMQNK